MDGLRRLCAGVTRRWAQRSPEVIRRRWAELVTRAEAGMTTAEYAVGTIAAVAFAVVLYRVVTSSAVGDAVRDIVLNALHSI